MLWVARVIHTVPDATTVDTTLPDGTVVFSNTSFEQIIPYIDVVPMDYTLRVRVSGTDDIVPTVHNVTLNAVA